MLGFATVGLGLFYLAYRYNILFVYDAKIDTKGLIYPRALQQLMTGVYIGELCMIGLFAIAKAWGPLALMIIFLVFSALFHISLNKALGPLLYNLPKSLEAEEESHRAELEKATAISSPNEKLGLADEKSPSSATTSTRPTTHKKPNFFTKWLHPEIYTDYATLRRLVPHDFADVDNLYDEETERDAYYPPSVTAQTPLLWVPRDEGGVSREEVAHTSQVIEITDEGATLDEKNNIVWDAELARPPIWKERVLY